MSRYSSAQVLKSSKLVALAAPAFGAPTKERELNSRESIRLLDSQDDLDFDFETTFTHNPNFGFFLS